MDPISGVISNTDVDSSEEIVSVAVRGRERLLVAFTTTVTLTAFTVEGNLTPAQTEASHFTLASVAADYTTPEGLVLGASGDLTVAAGGSTVHWLLLDVQGLAHVRIKAASTNGVIAGNWVLA